MSTSFSLSLSFVPKPQTSRDSTCSLFFTLYHVFFGPGVMLFSCRVSFSMLMPDKKSEREGRKSQRRREISISSLMMTEITARQISSSSLTMLCQGRSERKTRQGTEPGQNVSFMPHKLNDTQGISFPYSLSD